MIINSRELVECFFTGEISDKLPFMPWVCSFAAKLEQVTVKSMLAEPGLLTRALSNAHRLFNYDIILNHFDLSLEAESCGCTIKWTDENRLPVVTGHPLEKIYDISSLDTRDIEQKGRIPVIMEATKRLILTKGKEVPIAALVTGPLTLAHHLRGDALGNELEEGVIEASDLIEDTGSICLKLCRAYCELGVDIIVIAEDIHDTNICDATKVLASPMKSIVNVVKFFNAKSILVGRVRNDEQAGSLCCLETDAVSISGNADKDIVARMALQQNCAYSALIPDSVFLKESELSIVSEQEAGTHKQSRLFYSSEWDVPWRTEISSMQDVVQGVRK